MIALDTTAHSPGSAFNYTCTGTNLILIVFCIDGQEVITGCKYNGVDMVQVGTEILNNAGDFTTCWILKNPATGSHSIAPTGGSGTTLIYAESLTGAEQSNTPDAFKQTTGNTTAMSGTITTVKDNCWLVACGCTGLVFTPETNFTVRQSDGVLIKKRLGDSNGAITPAGDTIQSATVSATSWGLFQVSIAPAILAPTNNFLNFFK